MIGPLEADVIGVLNTMKEATATTIWEELTKKGKRTAYTTILTVLSRLYTRGFINKKEKIINNTRQYVYELSITNELKQELIKEHLDLVVRMFGDEAIRMIKQYVESLG